MKSILTLCLLFSNLGFIVAQDTIIFNSGEVIPAKVLTVSDDYIEYKKSTYLEGPVYKIDASKIETINLNGEKTESNNEAMSRQQGQIMQERRHYVSIGTGVFFMKNTREPGFILKADGTYFFSPVFGLGLSASLFQAQFEFSAVGNSPNGILNGKPSFIFDSEKTRVNHLLVTSTFSIPLKNFSLDYRIPFGYTSFKTNEVNRAYSISNGSSYSYRIDEARHAGYSFGGGMAMRFNLTEKSPITFSFGLDYLVTFIKPEFDITAYDPNSNQSFAYSSGDLLSYTSTNIFLQLTYQFNQIN